MVTSTVILSLLTTVSGYTQTTAKQQYIQSYTGRPSLISVRKPLAFHSSRALKAELALLCSSGGLIPQLANTPEIRVAHWAFVHSKPPLPVLLHAAWPREALGMNVTCAARHVHGRRRVCSRIKAHHALPFGLLFWNPLQRRRNDHGQSCHSWHVPWSNLNLG